MGDQRMNIMGDTPLFNELKDLPLKLQSASSLDRQTLFKNLSDTLCCSNSEVPEGLIRGVCRVLLLTLPRYTKNSSRKLVLDLLQGLLTHHNELTVQHLSASLNGYSSGYKDVASSATLAKDLLAAFNWSCLLLKNGFKVEANCSGDSFNQLVEAQANLYTSIATSKSKKLIDRACYRYSSFLHLHLIFDLLIDLNFLD